MTVEQATASRVDWIQRISSNRAQIVEVRICFDHRTPVLAHEAIVVRPGDRIFWRTCTGTPEGGCTEGEAEEKLRFKLVDFQVVADLELGMGGHVGSEHVPAERADFRTDKGGYTRIYHDFSRLRALSQPASESMEEQEHRAELLGRIFDPPHRPRQLFAEDWVPPADFRDEVLSAPIAREHGHWLWTYEIKLEDGHGEDPHIFMHEDPRSG